MKNTALNATLIFSLLLIFFAITKHLLLGSSTWDLGIFEQFSWLIANKSISTVSSLRGVTPLQDHFSLILIPIAYIYKLFSSTLTLLIIQSLALGTLPYLSLKNKKINKLYLALIIAIILSPIIFLVNLANFHPEVVSVPFMLLALQEARKERKLPYYLSFLISLSAKKSQILFGIGLSIYSFTKGKAKRALNTFTISVLWWFIASRYSAISGNYIQERLGYLGNSYLEILKTLFTSPWEIFTEAPPEQIILYTLGLTLPFLFIFNKKALPCLLGSLPVYLTNIISSAGSQRELYSQYSICILPFLIVACLDSIEDIPRNAKKRVNRIYFSTIIISCIAFIGYSRIGYFHSRYLPNLKEAIELHKIKSNISKNSAILTNNQIGAHFSNREKLNIIENNDYLKIKNYDYIILSKEKDLLSIKNKSILIKARNLKMQCVEANNYHIICKK